MKKVLIITYYWPPAGGGGVQRWVKFVKYLRDFGWEPIVYTVENGDYPVTDQTLVKEIPEDVTVLKQPIIEPYGLYRRWMGKKNKDGMDANFLSQGKKLGWKDRLAVWVRGNLFIPDARFLWIRPSVKYLTSYLTNYPVDAMISTGPPHTCHLIAYGVKKKMNIPWMVDYRDPWTQIDYFNDLSLTWPAAWYHISLEKKVLNHCNVIVAVGKTMAEDLNVLTKTQKVVITNGYDEADRKHINTTLEATFTITYIGTMNDARNPLVLWEALQFIKKNDKALAGSIKCRLVGQPESVIYHSIQKYDIEDMISFTGYVTHEEAIRYQEQAHVLLLIINNTSNNKSILTGKIFEYLASGRPILCIGPSDGDAADIIKGAKAGVMLDYNNVEGMVSQIRYFYTQYQEGKVMVNTKDIEKYSRKALTKELAGVLESITASR